MHLIRNENMSLNRIFSFAVVIFAVSEVAAQPNKGRRDIDIKSSDGTVVQKSN